MAARVTYLLDTNAISDLMRAAPQIENWMAGLDQSDRVVTCAIVRGEVLFGIARLPAGRRRTELEEAGRQLLALLHCEPVPERAGDFYAAVKLARQQRGLSIVQVTTRSRWSSPAIQFSICGAALIKSLTAFVSRR